jgi:hypothetical protein
MLDFSGLSSHFRERMKNNVEPKLGRRAEHWAVLSQPVSGLARRFLLSLRLRK